MILDVAVRVRRNVRAVQKRLRPFDPDVTVLEIRLAFAQRLHFRPRERDPRLELREDVVIVQRLLVRGDELLAGVRLRGHGRGILVDVFDAGGVAGGARETRVARDEGSIEKLRKGDVSGVV